MRSAAGAGRRGVAGLAAARIGTPFAGGAVASTRPVLIRRGPALGTRRRRPRQRLMCPLFNTGCNVWSHKMDTDPN